MEQHHGSHIDIVHHSIDHIIDGSISISSSVHEHCRIDQHQCRDIDSAICSNHLEPTNVSDSECRIDSNVHSIINGRSISVSTMATEHRWRIVMEQYHGSHIDIVHHSINQFIDGSISISSSVHELSRIDQHQCRDIDSAICSNHLDPTSVSDSEYRIDSNIHGIIECRSISVSTMATEHQWRIDMEQHRRSHIDIVHHSIDHTIDGSISISSSVHQRSRIDRHQCRDIDSAIRSNHYWCTNVSDSECWIDSNIHSISNSRSISVSTMATEHRWRIDMEQHHGSHIDIVHHSIDHTIDGSISISSIVHELSRIDQHQCRDIDSALCSNHLEPADGPDSECTIDSNIHSISNSRSISVSTMATEHQWRIDMEQHHGSHIDIVHHSIDQFIDGSISISSSVHELSRIDQHQFSDIDSAIRSNHYWCTNVSDSECTIDSNIHSIIEGRSISVSTMATEHQWRIDMEQHHGSHIDIVHHSINNTIDGSISISTRVHELSRIDDHQPSDIDSAICSNHHHSTNVSEWYDSNIHSIINSQSISVSTMATEHRWRIDMEQHHGSHIDIVYGYRSCYNRISSSVHQLSRIDH